MKTLKVLGWRYRFITDAERQEMANNLRGGGAALAVMADDFEVEATKAQMMSSGAKVEAVIFMLPDDAAEAITEAAAAQTDASEAVEEAVSELAEETADAVKSVSVDVPDLAPEAASVVAGLVAVGKLSPVDAAKLYEAGGVDNVSQLLEMAATPEGRQELADATGLDSGTILAAAKRLDLMRIKGVGIKYSTLLLAAGVDTVPEMALRNPKNLRAALVGVNAAESLVEEMPSAATLGDWVAQAKELPRIITY